MPQEDVLDRVTASMESMTEQVTPDPTPEVAPVQTQDPQLPAVIEPVEAEEIQQQLPPEPVPATPTEAIITESTEPGVPMEPEVPSEPATEVPLQQSPQDYDLEAMLDFDVDDLFDDESRGVLEQLRSRVDKKMSLAETIGLAGIALNDSALAQRMLENIDNDKREAQNTLTRLAGHVSDYRRSALQQHSQNLREENRQDAYMDRLVEQETARTNREELKQNSKFVQDRMKLFGKTRVSGFPAAPTDMTDAAAVQQWLVDTSPLTAEAQIVDQALDWFSQYLRSGGVAGIGQAREAFITQLTAAGVPKERATSVWGAHADMFEAQATLNKRKQDAQLDRLDAMIDNYDARTRKVVVEAEQVESLIGNGGVKEIRQAYQIVEGLSRQVSAAQQRIVSLRKQEQQWLAPPPEYMGTDLQKERLSEINAEVQIAQDFIQQTTPRITMMSSRLIPHADKLDFVGTYERIFDKALANIIMTHPGAGTDPTMVEQRIAYGMPGDPVKEAFWSSMYSEIKMRYPDLTLSEVQQVLEDEAEERFGHLAPVPEGMEEGTLSALGAGSATEGALSQEEEHRLWGQAAPAPGSGGTSQSTGRPVATPYEPRMMKLKKWATGIIGDVYEGVAGE